MKSQWHHRFIELLKVKTIEKTSQFFQNELIFFLLLNFRVYYVLSRVKFGSTMILPMYFTSDLTQNPT